MAQKILIVDDETDVLKIVVFRLKSIGYEVIGLDSGEGALELVRSEKPALIILDLRLPKISGEEICLKIKTDEALKHIPVIILTASSDEIRQVVDRCKANAYILKPFDAEELLAKTEEFLNRS